jgi:hypothetical protein
MRAKSARLLTIRNSEVTVYSCSVSLWLPDPALV